MSALTGRRLVIPGGELRLFVGTDDDDDWVDEAMNWQSWVRRVTRNDPLRSLRDTLRVWLTHERETLADPAGIFGHVWREVEKRCVV